MTLRHALCSIALDAATAITAISPAQVNVYPYGSYNRSTYGYTPYRGYSNPYGYGPFGPSYVPAPSYRYLGGGNAYRSGGVTFFFGNGGGYYGNYGRSRPVYGQRFRSGHSNGGRIRVAPRHYR